MPRSVRPTVPPPPATPGVGGAPAAEPRPSPPGATPESKRTATSDATRESRRLTELRADFQQQLREIQQRLDKKDAEVASLAAQQDTLRSLATVRAERIRELEAQLARKDETLQSLRGELEAAQTPPAQTSDDLTQMRGIGPTFERRLHEIGVVRFAQIAAWTDSDIVEKAAELKIHPGRISRDGWVASARELAGIADDSAPVDGEHSDQTATELP